MRTNLNGFLVLNGNEPIGDDTHGLITPYTNHLRGVLEAFGCS
jgi:hypothetical protein